MAHRHFLPLAVLIALCSSVALAEDAEKEGDADAVAPSADADTEGDADAVQEVEASPPAKTKRLLLGIKPQVTAETVAGENVLAVNALPYYAEVKVLENFGVRALPIFNLRLLGEQPVRVAHIGLEMVAPLYMWRSEGSTPYRGFYAGPVLSASYDLTQQLAHTYFAGEVGGSLTLFDRLVLNLGLQTGGTIIFGENYQDYVPHFGVVLSAGWWSF